MSLAEIYKKDWVFFIMHALGHYTWSKQREIIRSVQDNEKTLVVSAHGMSKTFSCAEACLSFYHTLADSKVITTAPTYPQVGYLLWPEIGKAQSRSRVDLPGRVNKTEIMDQENPTHYAYGFSTDMPSRAEGQHADNMLYVFDEGKGVPDWMWDVVRGAFAGGTKKTLNRWLVVSTTDGVLPGSQYERAAKPGSGWNIIHMSAFDSPYVTGENFVGIEWESPANPGKYRVVEKSPDEMTAQISNAKYIEEMRDPAKGYGEGSYLWQTKVLGLIVPMVENGIFTSAGVQVMFDNFKNKNYDTAGIRTAGIDCAWGGQDELVVYKRDGNYIHKPLVKKTGIYIDSHSLVLKTCDDICVYLGTGDEDKAREVRVDASGGGIGYVTELKRRGYNVISVINNEKANDQGKYGSIAAEQWDRVSCMCSDLAVSHDDQLRIELTNRMWGYPDARGRKTLEQKKYFKKKMGCSPNRADALILACSEPPRSHGVHVVSKRL